MKLLLGLGLVVGMYYYFLTQTTNLVFGQLQHIRSTYSTVATHADEIAAGSYR